MEKMLVGMKQLYVEICSCFSSFLFYSYFSCFVINWLGRYFSSVHQMRKETMKLLYRSACKTLQLKISSWNLTFSTISGGNFLYLSVFFRGVFGCQKTAR